MRKSKMRCLKKTAAHNSSIEKRIDYHRRKIIGNISQPEKQKKHEGIRNGKNRIWYNRTINYLYRQEFFHEKHKSNSDIKVVIPEDFSITNNFDEAMRFLAMFFADGLDMKVTSIEIDHTGCKNLGLSASCIMDELTDLLLGYRNFTKHKLDIAGIVPRSGAITDMLIVSGLMKKLNVSHDAKISSDVFPLPIQKNVTSDIGQTEVIEFLNDCFSKHGFQLTSDSVQEIGEMLGEIIDNCILHCGPDIKNQNLIGHYRLIPGSDCGECSISIFDFGKTIYETFTELDPNDQMIKELEDITQKHVSFFKRQWNRETLWTLYALQENVSCIRYRDPLDPGHGSGTIAFLSTFTKLKSIRENCNPKMCITSGHTQIIIDGTYTVGYNKKGQKVIAFNQENDLFKIPDEKYVFASKEYFPGTIISMKFYIDRKFLEKIVSEKEEVSSNENAQN